LLKKALAAIAALLCVFFIFAHYDDIMGFLSPRSKPDFEVSANPSMMTLNSWEGSSNRTVITVKSIDAFSGNISFEITPVYLVGDIQPTLEPSFVTLPASGQAQSVLTFYVRSLIPPGRYEVDVTGIAGSLRHSVRVTVTVSF